MRYSAADGPHAADGTILYVKPSASTGDEPLSVRTYANAHAAFPHEPTFDQWFSESQLESYRLLGLHTMDTVLRQALPYVRHEPGWIPTDPPAVADVLEALARLPADQLTGS